MDLIGGSKDFEGFRWSSCYFLGVSFFQVYVVLLP